MKCFFDAHVPEKHEILSDFPSADEKILLMAFVDAR